MRTWKVVCHFSIIIFFCFSKKIKLRTISLFRNLYTWIRFKNSILFVFSLNPILTLHLLRIKFTFTRKSIRKYQESTSICRLALLPFPTSSPPMVYWLVFPNTHYCPCSCCSWKFFIWSRDFESLLTLVSSLFSIGPHRNWFN